MNSFFSKKHILLTGGRGRLAGVIRHALSAQGAQLTSFSRTAGDSHLGLDTLFVDNLFDQADTLLHLAWSTVPMNSERNVGMEWEQDIPFLLKVLNAICRSPNREHLHFIFFSSGGAVYGNSPALRACSESDPCLPIGWYGHAKLAAERLIQEFGRRYGLIYTILRVSNPYGFQVPLHKPQGIIPIFLKHAREGIPLTVWGDGSARKDFIHYTDFTTALEQIIQRRLLGIFNVSSNHSHSVNDVIGFAEQALGKKISVQYGPRHAWDVHDSLLDNSKLRSAVDWHPKISLAEGIRLAASELL